MSGRRGSFRSTAEEKLSATKPVFAPNLAWIRNRSLIISRSWATQQMVFRGIGAKTAARLLDLHGSIDGFPIEVLGEDDRQLALLFKELATLRSDAEVFDDIDELRWIGPRETFSAWAERCEIRRLPPVPVTH